jgi:hypothetical protein
MSIRTSFRDIRHTPDERGAGVVTLWEHFGAGHGGWRDLRGRWEGLRGPASRLEKNSSQKWKSRNQTNSCRQDEATRTDSQWSFLAHASGGLKGAGVSNSAPLPEKEGEKFLPLPVLASCEADGAEPERVAQQTHTRFPTLELHKIAYRRGQERKG